MKEILGSKILDLIQEVHESVEQKVIESILKDFMKFLIESGNKENHGRGFPTLAWNDWYGLKYGNEDMQIFPILEDKDINYEDAIKRFKIWKEKRNMDFY